MGNRETRANQEDKRTSTKDECLILLTEIGAFEIPSKSAFSLKTWAVKREGVSVGLHSKYIPFSLPMFVGVLQHPNLSLS